MYRYITAALIVLGLAIAAGAETHGSLAMVAAQCGLGAAVLFSGYLFSTLIEEEDGDES